MKADITIHFTMKDGTKRVMTLRDCMVSDVQFNRQSDRSSAPVVHVTANPEEYPQIVDVEPFRWHYGPTDKDPHPGRMWHTGCGKEVLSFKEGLICECGAQSTPDDE